MSKHEAELLAGHYTKEDLSAMFISTRDQMAEYIEAWNDLRDIITRRCPEEIKGTKHEKKA